MHLIYFIRGVTGNRNHHGSSGVGGGVLPAYMYVAPNGTKPGDGAEVRIRGNRSINASNEPLYIIDGVPISGGSEISAQQVLILDERGRELLGEQFRWFDLVRTGKLVERARTHNPDVVAPIGNLQEFHTLRPIPQSQIDRTAGGEAAFPQNPGYN